MEKRQMLNKESRFIMHKTAFFQILIFSFFLQCVTQELWSPEIYNVKPLWQEWLKDKNKKAFNFTRFSKSVVFFQECFFFFLQIFFKISLPVKIN